jgi:two-component system sensor histidine kinase DegS
MKDSPFEHFLEECQKLYEQTQKELKEIDVLIQQTVAEVDRQAQRNMQAANRLRQIEANLESAPRDQIREAYSAVLETQQRLFTMRGQLEKLQSDQHNLEEYNRLLRRVLEFKAETQETEASSEEASIPTVVRVIEAQERERQSMARQMHDGPAQALTNLVLQAEICERLFDSDAERARQELANLKKAVASTFERVRGFISDLRPMMLDDLGLVPTMRRYTEDYGGENVHVHLTVTGRERRFASYKEVTIFRVIQSLLNNARDISHASNIEVSIDVGEERVQVIVEDNGSGFEMSELRAGLTGKEMGLDTLRERIEMLGGQFEADSSPGRGTRVVFTIPLP